jgi:hypothetical protein
MKQDSLGYQLLLLRSIATNVGGLEGIESVIDGFIFRVKGIMYRIRRLGFSNSDAYICKHCLLFLSILRFYETEMCTGTYSS